MKLHEHRNSPKQDEQNIRRRRRCKKKGIRKEKRLDCGLAVSRKVPPSELHSRGRAQLEAFFLSRASYDDDDDDDGRAYLSAARRVERIINEQERLVYPHVVDIFRHVTRAVFSSILPPPSFPTTSQLYYTYRSLSRRPRQAPVCTCGCSVLHILVKHAVT